MGKRATMPVPICATVSRSTGEIRFEYSRKYMDQVRFGQAMNRMSRIAEVFSDAEAKRQAGNDAFSQCGVRTLKMKGCENAPCTD